MSVKEESGFYCPSSIEVLENIDEDGSGMISKKEFESIKDDPIVKEALEEIGVEPKHLLASPRAQNAHDNAFGL